MARLTKPKGIDLGSRSIEGCPCGGGLSLGMEGASGFHLACDKCGAEGRSGRTIDEAITEWNKGLHRKPPSGKGLLDTGSLPPIGLGVQVSVGEPLEGCPCGGPINKLAMETTAPVRGSIKSRHRISCTKCQRAGNFSSGPWGESAREAVTLWNAKVTSTAPHLDRLNIEKVRGLKIVTPCHCPGFQFKDLEMAHNSTFFQVVCNHCGNHAAAEHSTDKAITEWNRKMQSPAQKSTGRIPLQSCHCGGQGKLEKYAGGKGLRYRYSCGGCNDMAPWAESGPAAAVAWNEAQYQFQLNGPTLTTGLAPIDTPELNGCDCGGDVAIITTRRGKFLAHCPDCGRKGFAAATAQKAANIWNGGHFGNHGIPVTTKTARERKAAREITPDAGSPPAAGTLKRAAGRSPTLTQIALELEAAKMDLSTAKHFEAEAKKQAEDLRLELTISSQMNVTLVQLLSYALGGLTMEALQDRTGLTQAELVTMMGQLVDQTTKQNYNPQTTTTDAKT